MMFLELDVLSPKEINNPAQGCGLAATLGYVSPRISIPEGYEHSYLSPDSPKTVERQRIPVTTTLPGIYSAHELVTGPPDCQDMLRIFRVLFQLLP